MQGGGLTRQDRRQIALGPAEGLAYAEIARGLDRPTSTIAREVTAGEVRLLACFLLI
jgi:IS30 family transposase